MAERKLPVFLSGDEPARLVTSCESFRDRLMVLLGTKAGQGEICAKAAGGGRGGVGPGGAGR